MLTFQGIFVSLLSTALPDFRQRLGVSTEQISRARAAKGVGMMAGGLAGGVVGARLLGKGRENVVLGGCVSLAGVAVMLQPWAPSVGGFAVLLVTEGVMQGSLDAGNYGNRPGVIQGMDPV